MNAVTIVAYSVLVCLGKLTESAGSFHGKNSSLIKPFETLEASLQAILFSAVDAIIIIRHDGILEPVKEAAAALFQYEIEEILGQNVKVLLPDTHRSKDDEYLHNYNTTDHRS